LKNLLNNELDNECKFARSTDRGELNPDHVVPRWMCGSFHDSDDDGTVVPKAQFMLGTVGSPKPLIISGLSLMEGISFMSLPGIQVGGLFLEPARAASSLRLS